MPAGIDVDDVELNERNGSSRVPAWEKFMRSKGASDEEVADARRDTQRDLTRARQKDTQKMATLEQKVDHLMRGGVQQPTAQNQELPWDAVFRETGLAEKAPELAKILSQAFTRQSQGMLGATQTLTQQAIAPVAQTLHNSRLLGERDALAKRFGEKRIAVLWPDIEAELHARIQRGENPRSAEDVFRESMPEEYSDAFFLAESQRRRAASEANKTKSSEGFIQTQRSQPMQIGDSRPSEDAVVDYEKITQDSIQEALKEVGLA